MKLKFITLMLFLSISSTSSAGPLLKTAIASSITADTADMITTIQTWHEPKLLEANPLFISRPLFIPIKIGFIISTPYFVNKLHQSHPKLANSLTFANIIVKSSFAYHNHKILVDVRKRD